MKWNFFKKKKEKSHVTAISRLFWQEYLPQYLTEWIQNQSTVLVQSDLDLQCLQMKPNPVINLEKFRKFITLLH